ncbi:MAG: DUF2974 domain-containing protein [Lachnospiraceae bacterium]|nr:DUF2974 domain-containing protein [Lachnospiraceae bacterium]
MDRLTEYVLWMSDFPISMTGLRDADVLVLCNLVYIDLSPLFEGEDKELTVRDCQKLIDTDQVEEKIAIRDKKYKELLQAAVDSVRFGDLRIADYIDILCEEPPVQYASVTFRDDRDFAFIAFRGTDDTLAGWYEDSIASFTITGAQLKAKEYAAALIAAEPERRWFMGGHSKGGNLALYAGSTMGRELFEHVERIYDLDGPGLCEEVMEGGPDAAVLEKTTRILPEFSVVGKLFDMDIPDTKIIKSFAKGMFQHAPITWGIDHGKIALTEKNHPLSIRLSDFIAKWIAQTSIEERKVFLAEIYEAVTAGGARTLEDLITQGWDGFKAVQQRLKNSGDVTKHVMQEFTKQAFQGSFFPGAVSGPSGKDEDKREDGNVT